MECQMAKDRSSRRSRDRRRMIGAGFVKLSEEELEKRHKEGACFNATGRATIAEIVESLGVSRTRRITEGPR